MRRLPNLLFIIDVRRDALAIKEANTLGIPVIAMVDTNCDPEPIDYVIPSNDDAIRAIKLMVNTMANAAVEGRTMLTSMQAEEEEAAGIEGEEAMAVKPALVLKDISLMKSNPTSVVLAVVPVILMSMNEVGMSFHASSESWSAACA